MPENAARRNIVATTLSAAALLALVSLWEPIDHIFRRIVELNHLFVGILAIVTVAASVAAILVVRAARRASMPTITRIAGIVSAIEVVFLIVVWVTIFVTGAYRPFEEPVPAGHKFELQHSAP